MEEKSYDYNIYYIKRDTPVSRDSIGNLQDIAEKAIIGYSANSFISLVESINHSLHYYVSITEEMPDIDYDVLIIAQHDNVQTLSELGHTSARYNCDRESCFEAPHPLMCSLDETEWYDLSFHVDTETAIDSTRESMPSHAFIAESGLRNLPPSVIAKKCCLYSQDVNSTTIKMLKEEMKDHIAIDLETMDIDILPKRIKKLSQLMAVLTRGEKYREYLGYMTFTDSGAPVYTRY